MTVLTYLRVYHLIILSFKKVLDPRNTNLNTLVHIMFVVNVSCESKKNIKKIVSYVS